MTWKVEVTDTFGGEANYSWVKRYTLELDENSTNLRVVRAAKKAADWTGINCEKFDFGDYIQLHPSGLLQVMFIQWVFDK